MTTEPASAALGTATKGHPDASRSPALSRRPALDAHAGDGHARVLLARMAQRGTAPLTGTRGTAGNRLALTLAVCEALDVPAVLVLGQDVLLEHIAAADREWLQVHMDHLPDQHRPSPRHRENDSNRAFR